MPEPHTCPKCGDEIPEGLAYCEPCREQMVASGPPRLTPKPIAEHF